MNAELLQFFKSTIKLITESGFKSDYSTPCSQSYRGCVNLKHYACLDTASPMTRTELLNHAMATGSIEVAVYLRHVLKTTWSTQAAGLAAARGYLMCLYYAYDSEASFGPNVCASAAGYGCLSCLKFAHEVANAPLVVDLTTVTNKDCADYLHEHRQQVAEALVAFQRLPELKNVLTHYGCEHFVDYARFKYTAAILSGALDVSEDKTVCDYLRSIVDQLCAKPNEFIGATKDKCHLTIDTKPLMSLYTAILYARFDILERLMAQFTPLDAKPSAATENGLVVSYKMMSNAASCNNLDMFKYLFEVCNGGLWFNFLKLAFLCSYGERCQLIYQNADCLRIGEKDVCYQYVYDLVTQFSVGSSVDRVSRDIVLGVPVDRFMTFDDPESVEYLFALAAKSQRGAGSYEKLLRYFGPDPNPARSLTAALLHEPTWTKQMIINGNPGLRESLWTPELVAAMPLFYINEYWPSGARKNLLFGVAKVGGVRALEVMAHIVKHIKDVGVTFDADNDNPEYILTNWSTVSLDIADAECRSFMTSIIKKRFVAELQVAQNEAAKTGDDNNLRLLIDTWGLPENKDAQSFMVELASAGGYLAAVEVLVGAGAQCLSDSFYAAARNGDLTMLEYLFSESNRVDVGMVAYWAARYGRADCLEYALVKLTGPVSVDTVIAATKSGSLPCLEVLLKHGQLDNKTRLMIRYLYRHDTDECLVWAQENIDLAITRSIFFDAVKDPKVSLVCLKYICAHIETKPEHMFMYAVANTKYVDLIQYLMDDLNVFVTEQTFKETTVAAALKNIKNDDVRKFFRNHVLSRVAVTFLKNGSVDGLVWVLDKLSHDDIDRVLDDGLFQGDQCYIFPGGRSVLPDVVSVLPAGFLAPRHLEMAVKNGNFNVAVFLYRNCGLRLPISVVIDGDTIVNKDKVLKYFNDICPKYAREFGMFVDPNVAVFAPSAQELSVRRSTVACLQCRYCPDCLGPSSYLVCFYTHETIEMACRHGHLTCAKSLASILVKHTLHQELFTIAVVYGHLEIMRWLYSSQRCVATVEWLNLAASEGHLHIVKYLVDELGIKPTSHTIALAADHVGVVLYLATVTNPEPVPKLAVVSNSAPLAAPKQTNVIEATSENTNDQIIADIDAKLSTGSDYKSLLLAVIHEGRLDCLMYLLQHKIFYYRWFENHRLIKSAFEDLVDVGNLACLVYFYDALFDLVKVETPKRLETPLFPRSLVMRAAHLGNTDVFAFICETVGVQDQMWAMDTFGLRDVLIDNDHVDCLDYYMNSPLNGRQYHSTSITKRAAQAGSLKCFKYAVEQFCPYDKQECLAATESQEIIDFINSRS